MASYKIQWKRSAKKELRKLDKQIILRILHAIAGLEANPYPSGSKKLIERSRSASLHLIANIF